MEHVTTYMYQTWKSARPVCCTFLAAITYFISSLLCAVPIALLTGRKVLGIWYILPFTLLFIWITQRLVHRESLLELGIRLHGRWKWKLFCGFMSAGLVFLLIKLLQLGFGWITIAPGNVFQSSFSYVVLGITLAIILNLAIGFGEELLFRGYFFRRLLQGYPTRTPAVVFSAALFAVSHLQRRPDSYSMIHLFLFGLLLALVFILTKTLWMSIGIHTGWDFWGDGIYYVYYPGMGSTRLFNYQHLVSGPAEFYAFKFILDLVMIALICVLILKLHHTASSKASNIAHREGAS